MTKFAWVTDPHLNFLKKDDRIRFYLKINESESDGVFITGDIGEADSTLALMDEMTTYLSMPVYFILGNHDFYGSSVEKVHDVMLKASHPKGLYLGSREYVKLTDKSAVLGENGWADARFGDYANSKVVMNDWIHIEDLREPYLSGNLIEKIRELADFDANSLKYNIWNAIEEGKFKQLIILTHVPPFVENCVHRGKATGEEYLPFYSSKVMGEMLMQKATEYPDIDFIVLCGHTHTRATFEPLPNLLVMSGESTYYKPKITGFIDVM